MKVGKPVRGFLRNQMRDEESLDYSNHNGKGEGEILRI